MYIMHDNGLPESYKYFKRSQDDKIVSNQILKCHFYLTICVTCLGCARKMVTSEEYLWVAVLEAAGDTTIISITT